MRCFIPAKKTRLQKNEREKKNKKENETDETNDEEEKYIERKHTQIIYEYESYISVCHIVHHGIIDQAIIFVKMFWL